MGIKSQNSHPKLVLNDSFKMKDWMCYVTNSDLSVNSLLFDFREEMEMGWI